MRCLERFLNRGVPAHLLALQDGLWVRAAGPALQPDGLGANDMRQVALNAFEARPLLTRELFVCQPARRLEYVVVRPLVVIVQGADLLELAHCSASPGSLLLAPSNL